MWKRTTLLLVLALLLIPLAQAAFCEDRLTPGLNCTMVTPALSCVNYTYDVINSTGQILVSRNLTTLNQSIYQLNFNQSVGDYVVRFCDNSTQQIRVTGEDDGLIFFAILTVFMFLATIIIVGIIRAEKTWLKIFLFAPLWTIIVGIFRLSSVFLGQIYPNLTSVTTLLDNMYSWSVSLLYPFIGICLLLTIYTLIRDLKGAAEGKEDKGGLGGLREL